MGELHGGDHLPVSTSPGDCLLFQTAVIRAIGSCDPGELVRVALWAALSRSDHAAVLVGFTSAQQVRMNVAAVAAGPPPAEVVDVARQVMSQVQARLDADGPVFLDERPAPDPTKTVHGEGVPG
jgi:hypothetical protein